MSARARYTLYVVLFLGLGAFYGAWVWSPTLGDFGDHAVDLLTARYFHGGAGSALAGRFAASSPHPPLYALTLAAFGGASSFLGAHLVTAATLLLSLAVFLFWLRTLEVPAVPALLTTLAFGLTPGLEMQALEISSAPLYLLLSLLALAAATNADRTGDARWRWLCSGAVALTLLTRTTGLALWAALILWLLLRRPRRDLFLGVAALLPFLVWQGWHTYGNPLWRWPGDPLLLLSGRALDMRPWAAAWATDLTGPLLKPPFLIVAGVVAALGMVGSVRRLPALDAIYALFYLGMLLVTASPTEASQRLLVILPVLIVAAVQSLTGLERTGAVVRITVVLAVLILALPQTLFHLWRLRTQEFAALSAYKHFSVWYTPDPSLAVLGLERAAALTRLLQSLPTLVPADECILSVEPALTTLYSGRASYKPPVASMSAAAFWAQLRAQHCRYDLLMDERHPPFPGFYPLARLAPVLKHRVAIVAIAPLLPMRGAPVSAILLRLPSWPPTGQTLAPTPGRS